MCPCGLVRQGSYLNGSPVELPLEVGTPVDWVPSPEHFGNPVPPTDPSFNSNVVDWDTPDPSHFGNIILDA
jgi:hypothetical protein